jgi:hypothetical protein
MTGSAGNYLVRCKKNRRRKLAIKIAEPPVSLPLLLSLQTSTSGVKFSIESGNSKQPLVDLDSLFVGANSIWQKNLSFITFTVKSPTQILSPPSSPSPTTKHCILWPFHHKKDQN